MRAVVSYPELGRDPCPSLSLDEVVQQLGHHPLPYISIGTLARDALRAGMCLQHPKIHVPYGQWYKDVSTPAHNTHAGTLMYKHLNAPRHSARCTGLVMPLYIRAWVAWL